MSRVVMVLAVCGLVLGGCVEMASSGGPGRAAADPADQSPNH